jgi:hypothetical protein
VAALAISGCGLVTVEMTSMPDTVRNGEPVTFDIKLTNQSPCPMDTTVAFLAPFISASDINAEFSRIPPDAPPEIVAFVEALRAFIEDLCSGGTPMLPTPPIGQEPGGSAASLINAGLSGGCDIVKENLVCEISARVREPGNGLTFTLFDDLLHCVVDDQVVRCELSLPLGRPSAPPASAASGGAAAVTQLSCFTVAQLEELFGVPPDALGDEGIGALCFVGTPPMIGGLGPNEMATGQVVLPARGAGVMRNFVFATSDDGDEAGVCRGGSEPGAACDRDFSGDCAGGGTCAEGICSSGGNAGQGCNVATQAMDCPGGGMCLVCSVPPPAGTLPFDCTTTYVSPEGAPLMSSWGLVGTAAILLAAGTLWLQRRQRRG